MKILTILGVRPQFIKAGSAIDQAKQYKNFTTIEKITIDRVDINGEISYNVFRARC